MPKRLHIPPELLKLNPTLQLKEIRAIIQVILKAKGNILRQSTIVDIRIPKLGRIKSHGNKKKNTSKALLQDRRRKRLEKRKKELTIEKLLF